ncbi:MAG: hypothetical protein QOK85_08435 [Nitrososphaeraceae archaeon]|nr:hypothetical protein [Nitrososphaeraceae archaeon]
MQEHKLRGHTIISIAIFVGGIVFIALGIGIFSKAANFSETVVQDYLDNKTSGVKSIIAKTVTDALSPTINTLTQVSKGITTSIAAFLCLVGIGICMLGIGLFKVKYLAWIITVVLMFVAIVIDVLGLGFVGGSLPSSPDDKGIMSADFAYLLIGIMIAHLLANAFIIYYLTKKSTASIFRTL